MAIESTHEQYDEAVEGWELVKDCIAGSRRIKDRGETYLPKLNGQSQDEYESYKKRGNFFNGTATACSAQTGLITRKQPEVETEIGDEWLADVDLQGNSLQTYLAALAMVISSTGRAATVVDWSEAENRPYFSFYNEIDILDWHTSRIKGLNKLDMLKVRQQNDELEDDGITTRSYEEIRVFRLEDEKLIIEVYRRSEEEKGKLELQETITPSRKGKPLDEIPVSFHGSSNTKPDVGAIPLEDIAQINASHYRTSVDLEHARHIAALPTPYATGITSNNAEYRLGTDKAWVAEDPQATFGFLEFTGAGLSELTKALEEKEKQMSALGARLLFAGSRDAEAYETVQLRASADTASLGSMSSAISASMTRAMAMAAWWSKGGTNRVKDFTEKNFIVMSQDYVTSGMPPERITAMVSALQMGAISYETFFYNLQKGEIYQEGHTQEDELKAISTGGLPMGKPPEPEPKPKPKPEDK